MTWFFRILWITGICLLLVAFYPNDPGDILIRLPSVGEFQTTPFVFMLIISLILLFAVIIFQLFHWLFSLPIKLTHKFKENRLLRADERLLTGWTWLSSGGHDEALQLAKKTHKSGIATTEASLLAAHAELEMQHFEASSEWLELVDTSLPRHQLLKNLIQAKLHLQANELEEVQSVINKLEKQSGTNSVLGRLRIQAFKQDCRWTEMLKLTKNMHKKGLASDSDYLRWLCKARIGEFHDMVESVSSNKPIAVKLLPWWKKIEASTKKDPVLLKAILSGLDKAMNTLKQDGRTEALSALQHTATNWLVKAIEPLLETHNNNHKTVEVSKQMLEQYTMWTPTNNLVIAINQCQKWLTNTKENASLLRTTAKLCARQELWGNAIRYYETSLSFEANNTAIMHLSEIYRTTEQLDKAQLLQAKLTFNGQP